MYQRYVNASNALALEDKDQVNFILVYVVEPHPMAPDISPYRGKVWTFKYSDRHQARTMRAWPTPSSPRPTPSAS